MPRHIHTEIEIDAPADEVWRALTDWSTMSTWSRWVVSIAGELRVGAPLDVQLKLGPRNLGIQPRVTRLEEGRGFAWLGHAGIRGIFDGEHSFDVEPISDSRARFIHAERFGGLLSGITLALIGKQIRAGFEAFNRSLKQRCEARPTASPTDG